MSKLAEYEFSVIDGKDLERSLAKEISDLFSSSYGQWSKRAPINPGQPIRLGPSYYLKNYAARPYRIAICRDADRLVAEAIYIEKATSRGRVSLVVQLVVDKSYRRQGIATALLHAIWGFSDYFAWGIVTSSPCTVEALEGATFRRCRADVIASHSAFVRRAMLADVPFMKDAPWICENGCSRIDTGFFTDRRARPFARKRVEARLGRLCEGEEWLAVTFREQPLDLEEAYSQIIACSGSLVAEAYRRMPQTKQAWTRKTCSEVDSILRWLPSVRKDTAKICDFGAGSGRHMMEFKRRGYAVVDGIDFAPSKEARRLGVSEADCRSWKSSTRYDLILCLYDVIGSFPDEKSNLAILKNIVRHLAPEGHAVISVSNAAYGETQKIPLIGTSDRMKFARSVFRMKASNVMATTGEFFTGRGFVKDLENRFYHKEQFMSAALGLPGEYLVVDRRYTAGDLQGLLEKVGLKVVLRQFVRAGFSQALSESDGKEILVIARR